MTNTQLFQWLGITFFAMGIGMLTNPKFIKDIIRDFLVSTAYVFFGGLICLAIGLPLVTFHNVWMLDSSFIITFLGWLALIKGLALIMFPIQTMRMYKGALAKENKSYVSYGVIAIGIVLLYFGYFV